MHRPTIALITIVLLAIGVYTQLDGNDAVSSACLRMGTIMAIMWLAQPQLQHVPRWLVVMAGGVLLVAMRWPKLLVFALPLAAALWVLSPWGAKAALARRRQRDQAGPRS